MKRISLIITFTLLMLMAVVGSFSLLMLTAHSAYAHPAGTPINETRSAKADGEVRVSNVAGSVTVRGWDKAQVHVSGTLGAGTQRLDVSSDGSGVSIRVILPEHSRSNVEGTDLVIDVPKASRLTVNTVSADISASGLTGIEHLESVSGNLSLDSRSSDIGAQSVSGEVNISGSASRAHIRAHSISGDVKISGVDGELVAESVSSTVKVTASNLSRAQLSSTSGNVDFAAAIGSGGSYEFHSISGNVNLSFAKLPDARFDISSFSGNITNSIGPKATRTSEYGPGMELHFTSGHGDAQVNAKTLSGNISLRD